MSTVLNHQFTNGVARRLVIECQDERQNDAWDEFVESLPGAGRKLTLVGIFAQ